MPRRRSLAGRVRPLWLAATLGAVSIVALTSTGTAAASTDATTANSFGSEMFGVSVGGELQNEDSGTLARDLDAIQAAGSQWMRIDINWAQIQAGGPSSYEWDPIDRVVEGATARGMKILGVIEYTPEWARPRGTRATYGPEPGRYADFAATAVEHYAAMGVHAYEVWNEPNIDAFWTPAPDVSHYTQLLKAAYPAIKGADPQATVLTGGNAPAPSDGTDQSPVDFLKGIYANGGGDSFDAVSHHPYCWPADPGDPESWSAWHLMNRPGTSLRSVMSANGDAGKKIWATEFGAPTNGPSDSSVTEQTQAQMITKAYSLWRTYDWAGPLFTYEGRDLGTSTDTRENFFGMLRHDFSRKPSYKAYQAAAGGGAGPGGGPGPGGGSSGGSALVDTATIVKGKGGGGGQVKGKVSPKERSSEAAAAVHGTVKLLLSRKLRGGWRFAADAQNTELDHGRFYAPLSAFRDKLRRGTYRINARYQGSFGARPSAARSRKFKLRG